MNAIDGPAYTHTTMLFLKSLHAGKRWFLPLIRRNIVAYVRTYDKWNFKSKKSPVFHFDKVNNYEYLQYCVSKQKLDKETIN